MQNKEIIKMPRISFRSIYLRETEKLSRAYCTKLLREAEYENEHIEFDELYRLAEIEAQGRYTAKKRRRNWNTLLSAKNAMKGIALLH